MRALTPCHYRISYVIIGMFCWIEGRRESIRFSVCREQEVTKCLLTQIMDCTKH